MSKSIIFSEIQMEELKPLITLAFQDDPALLEQYSLLKTDTTIPTLEESVNKNFETITEAYNDPVYRGDMHFYKVVHNGTEIGFTVIVENAEPPHMLFSFGINIHYRSRKINAHWLQEIKDRWGKFIVLTLHNNNSRAIDYFKKNGFTAKVDEAMNSTTLLSNYNEFGKRKLKMEVAHGS